MTATATPRSRVGPAGSVAAAAPPRVSAVVELVRAGVGLAVGANLLSAVLLVGLVVVGWTSAQDQASSWHGAARVGGAVWLMAHLVDVSLGLPVAQGGTGPLLISLSPLGATALVAALHFRSGRRLARLAGMWSALPSTVVLAVVSGSATTVIIAAGLARWASGPAVAVAPLPAALGCGAFAAAAMVAGISSRTAGRIAATLPSRLGSHLRRCVPAALVAITAWLMAGAVGVAVALIARIATVVEAEAALGPGGFGGFWLLIGQVGLLPNAIVWAAGVLSGIPFEVGDHSLSLSGSQLLPGPPLPLLSVVPSPGVWPLWAWSAVLLVVGCGALAGWHAHRHPERPAPSLLDRLADAVAIASMTGAAASGLAWLAAGSVAGWGPVGAAPLLLGATVAAEVAAGAIIAAVTLHLVAPPATAQARRR